MPYCNQGSTGSAKNGRRMANHTARLRRHMEIVAAMMIDETLAIVGELAPSPACTLAQGASSRVSRQFPRFVRNVRVRATTVPVPFTFVLHAACIPADNVPCRASGHKMSAWAAVAPVVMPVLGLARPRRACRG